MFKTQSQTGPFEAVCQLIYRRTGRYRRGAAVTYSTNPTFLRMISQAFLRRDKGSQRKRRVISFFFRADNAIKGCRRGNGLGILRQTVSTVP